MSKDNNNISDISSTNDNSRTSIYQQFGVEKSIYEQKIKNEDKNKIECKKSDENEQENYIKINTKNQFEIYNSEESFKKLDDILNYAEELFKETSIKEISSNFIDKLFPNCNRDTFKISKMISNKMKRKITKKLIEEKLDFFYQNRTEFHSKKLILTREYISNIGYILCYSYSKFEDNIKEKKHLVNLISLCLSKKINVLNNFFSYCNEKGKNPQDMNIFKYLEKEEAKKYLLPGVFLFLMCCFDDINILELDMNVINNFNQKSNDDFYLFIISIFNIDYLATKTARFKLNFNNEKLQKDIYSFFDKELASIYRNQNRDFKKNKNLSQRDFYKKRWNFETDYILNKQINSSKKEDDNNTTVITNNNDNNITGFRNKSIKFEELSFIDIDKDSEIEDSQFNESKERTCSLKINKYNITDSYSRSQTYETDSFLQIDTQNFIRKLSYTENFENIIKDEYDIMVENNKNILELLSIVIFNILRLKNLKELKSLELVINDCYYKEFINLFENIASSSKESTINNFHILDIFNKMKNDLERFNVEFNCLDYLTFYKILSIINKNKDLKSLQISFFASLISYSPQYIYKIYQQNCDKKEIETGIESLESYILKEFLQYFIENFEVLFELIKSRMTKFAKLGFVFDIPDIISKRQRYLIVILKFILNILFLIDSPKSEVKKLIILSPKTILEPNSFYIEEILDSINLAEKSIALQELSLQLQFYRISNIKNLISYRLIYLKLGDLDIFTLKGLTKHLCSYNFYKNSSLNVLTIGLLNNITKFTKEIKYLLNELFAIKLKKLKKLNVYSNIFIEKEDNFYKIFKNNWIPSCCLILNEKSLEKINEKDDNMSSEINIRNSNKTTINVKNKEKKIYYLLHHELEEEILNANEKALRKKKQISTDECDIAWYLKYILIFRYSKKGKDGKNNIGYYDQKNIIFNILKYLYFTKAVKIITKLNDNSTNNNN